MNTLKTILYMGVTHGLFTFFLPYQLASRTARFELWVLHYLAIPFWFIGIAIIVRCSVDFIRRGRGTPAHFDPPSQLVIAGLYRHVRNPIYLGALMVQFGYILWFGSAIAVLYTSMFFLAYHFLIVVLEEPILRKTFGDAYAEYCRTVPRWVPRLKT